MNFLKEILVHNQEFLQKQEKEAVVPKISKFPQKEAIILTCMDTRLVGLLEQAIGKSRGECKFIKNAGAIVAHPFGGVMRSIIVAIYELKVSEVVVIAHKDCGMAGIDPEKIEKKIMEAGVSPEILRGIESTGMNLDQWFSGFTDIYEHVRKTTENIRKHPLIPDDYPVHGLVIDPDTGELELVVDGYELAHQQTHEEYRKESSKQ